MKAKMLVNDYGTKTLIGKTVDCKRYGRGIMVKGSVLNRFGGKGNPDTDMYFSKNEFEEVVKTEAPKVETEKTVKVKLLNNGGFLGCDECVGKIFNATEGYNTFKINGDDLISAGSTHSGFSGSNWTFRKNTEAIEVSDEVEPKTEYKAEEPKPITKKIKLLSAGIYLGVNGAVGKVFDAIPYGTKGGYTISGEKLINAGANPSAFGNITEYLFRAEYISEDIDESPKFKVGDKVKIKSVEVLKSLRNKDVVDTMDRYADMIFTIKAIRDPHDGVYKDLEKRYDLEGNHYDWYDYTFDKVEEPNVESLQTYKVGDLVKIKSREQLAKCRARDVVSDMFEYADKVYKIERLGDISQRLGQKYYLEGANWCWYGHTFDKFIDTAKLERDTTLDKAIEVLEDCTFDDIIDGTYTKAVATVKSFIQATRDLAG